MTTATTATNSTKTNETKAQPVVVSTGCPRGIGPEVAVVAAHQLGDIPVILIGNRDILASAAKRRGLSARFIERALDYAPEQYVNQAAPRVAVFDPGPQLSNVERGWGKPKQEDGVAQLLYVEQAFRISQKQGWALCTGPVSKEAIARSGLARAKKFRGHTEWLQHMDGAPYSVMCFQSEALTTSLVTTHVPIRRLSKMLEPQMVERATVELFDLIARLGKNRPHLAVCSLNPHAGEGELLGTEETTAIIPGIDAARARLGRRAKVSGPIGAETAYRKGAAGAFDGVVAIYHDQATIPMKLLAFGDAVNVTQGLSVVRTSVDHGTAYDIAGTGIADAQGMIQAMILATRLSRSRRKI